MSDITRDIATLKYEARRAYASMRALASRGDCGHNLMSYISSDYDAAVRRFDAIMVRLREIDPACPKP
jgi:hypothetical protein